MPEIHLRQLGFACGPFAKNKKRLEDIQDNKRFKIYLSKRTR